MNNTFDRLVSELQKVAPFKIRYKDEAIEMHLLHAFIHWFCPTFLTHYTTVIGSTVYFPSRDYVDKNPESSMRILAHEAVHLLDMQKWSSPVFMISYLMPQILALGIFSFPWTGLWSLLFLLFLLPIPSPFRFYFESRGYAVDVLTAHTASREVALSHAIGHFSDWNYYKMFPFPETVRANILHWVGKAERGEDPILLKILLIYELVAEN